MSARMDYTKVGSGALRAMHGLEKYLAESSIEAPLRDDIPRATANVDIASFAPQVADGFFLVPRLASHEEE